MKNTHFRLGFTRFLVISGPWAHHYFSRQAREVILMGPRTGNDQKTGKTRRKWVFFILRNQSALKLKKVVHITVYSVESLWKFIHCEVRTLLVFCMASQFYIHISIILFKSDFTFTYVGATLLGTYYGKCSNLIL